MLVYHRISRRFPCFGREYPYYGTCFIGTICAHNAAGGLPVARVKITRVNRVGVSRLIILVSRDAPETPNRPESEEVPNFHVYCGTCPMDIGRVDVA